MANISGYRFIIEELVRHDLGKDAYMHLVCCAPHTTFHYGFSLGLISRAELEAAEKSYGRLWNYVGD